MISRRITILFSALIIIALAASGFAQQPARQVPPDRVRPSRETQKTTTDAGDNLDQDRAPLNAPLNSDEAMRRAIANLSTQVNSLTTEVKLLRRATERNSQTIELLLYEERLAKVEEKLDAAIERKAELDAREQDIQRRLRNIQQEVMLRGGLRRDEAEAALRAEYQRALEDVKNQQSLYQQRISELQTQASRLRVRVETLRKKIERVEERSEQQQQQ
jgi:chromosome segregation ATPase